MPTYWIFWRCKEINAIFFHDATHFTLVPMKNSIFRVPSANTQHWTYRFFSFSTLNVLECTVWVNLASACIFPNNKPVKNVYFVAFSSIYVVQLYTLALFLEALESYANVNIFYFYLGAVAAAVPVAVVVVSTADIVTVWFFSLL